MRLAKNRMNARDVMLMLGVAGLAVGSYACSLKDPGNSTGAQVDRDVSGAGTLSFTANGEDFVRDGLLSSDQWQVTFDHVYVTFDSLVASQQSIGSSSDLAQSVKANPVQWDGEKTVDLVASETPVITELAAPAGQYPSFAWRVSPATQGPAKDASMLIEGQATKDAQTLEFALKFNPTLAFSCGAYVGDERKGIVQDQKTAELEATFHFDHLFGDGNAPPDDEMNLEALGIQPLLALAQSGALDIDLETLSTQLSQEDSNKLKKILLNLGHVGEGHCEASSNE